MNDDITFIIPNRDGKNIDFVLMQLHKFYPDSKYIVITQNDDKPFVRGQLFNIAYNYVDTKYMCFIDNDIFFTKPIDLIGIYNKLNCIALQPFTHIQQVGICLGRKRFDIFEYRKKKTNSKGGITFISKNNFESINGMSNLYVGWGYEDNEFDSRSNSIKDITGTISHIMHPRRNQKTKDLELNKKYYKERDNRNSQLDGYKNTTYNLTKDEIIDNVRYLYVENIYVNSDFTYKDLLDEHYLIHDM